MAAVAAGLLDFQARPVIGERRRTYAANWFDALGRPTSAVDYGTNGEEKQKTVTIANRAKAPVRLIYSTSSGQGCFARVPREPVPALGSLAVPVVVRAQGTGKRTVSIQIQTDLALQPSVNVPVEFAVGGSEPSPKGGAASPLALTARKETAP